MVSDRWRTLVAVALVVQLQPATPVWVDKDPLVALQKAEATWARSKPKTYQFTVEVRCFCPVAARPVSFRVSGEKSELLDSLDDLTWNTYESYGSIDKLFVALDRVAAAKPFKMAVNYDRVLGYPIQADLDPREDTKDDELYLRVTAFKILSDPRERVWHRPDLGPAASPVISDRRHTPSMRRTCRIRSQGEP